MLLYDAEIVAEVDIRTIGVFTVKVALVLPAGTVTLEGTLAAALLLESVTSAPPAEAGPLSFTVPVEDPKGPPTTLVGADWTGQNCARHFPLPNSRATSCATAMRSLAMTSENTCETWAFAKSCLHRARLGSEPISSG